MDSTAMTKDEDEDEESALRKGWYGLAMLRRAYLE